MTHTSRVQVSASDVALSVSSLLESPTSETADWTDNWRRAALALSANHWEALSAGIQLSMAYQRTILNQVRAATPPIGPPGVHLASAIRRGAREQGGWRGGRTDPPHEAYRAAGGGATNPPKAVPILLIVSQ